ncbi:MAG: hypothetical protein ACU4EQ_09155 [Candidatus Nitrosoglobus sp.]|jgi:hypothetical protein
MQHNRQNRRAEYSATRKAKKSAATPDIQAVVKTTVETGVILCTDEHAAYRGMDECGHKSVNCSAK